MRITTPVSRVALAATLLALALPAGAVAEKAAVPRATTLAATHILGTSAVLTATIIPNKVETSYQFQIGASEKALTISTPLTAVGNGEVPVKVGQLVNGLSGGATYYFRVVAYTSTSTIVGKTHTFKTHGAALAFVLPRRLTATYGRPFVLNGSLTGHEAPAHRVEVQASPFPFLESFTLIGSPGVTNANGRFSFRLSNLTSSTQIRMNTLDPLPIFSPVVTITVAVRVVLHVHASGQRGLYRLYGTIFPAVHGAKVLFQVEKAVRPNINEISTRFITQAFTGVKHGLANTSRFSKIVKIKHGGTYRAYVKLPSGQALVSGSSLTVALRG